MQSPLIIIFSGYLLVLVFITFLIHHRQRRSCTRTSCLLKLRCSPGAVRNVTHRRLFDSPGMAEDALRQLSVSHPEIRCLLCRRSGQWEIISGPELTIRQSGPTPSDTDFFYHLKSAPRMEAAPTVERYTDIPGTVEERYAMRHELLNAGGIHTSRHGSLESAREEFFRHWERSEGKTSQFLLRSLTPNDTAWYVVVSDRKMPKDALFLSRPSGHLTILDQRG